MNRNVDFELLENPRSLFRKNVEQRLTFLFK